MKRKSKKFSHCWAGGFTLVEALAGMVILGTLLTTIVVANAKLISQASRAKLRVEACEIADGLLEKWWAKKDDFPRNGSGDVPNREGWRWRTRSLENESAETLNAEIIALEVFSPDWQDVLPTVRIEILLPKKKYEIPKRTDTD